MPGVMSHTVYISSGVTSSGLSLNRLYSEVVESGGTAVQNNLELNGRVFVQAGGVTQSDTVSSGGFEVVSAGGSAYATMISSGGVLDGGGFVIDATDYGALSGVTVERGGPLALPTYVESGGSASAVTVAPGGVLDIQGSGLANSTTVLNGFFGLVSGAQEAYATVSGAKAYMDVGPGCSAYADLIIGGTMLIEGGAENLSAPSAEFTFISAGGVVSNLDVVEAAQIAAGGTLDNGSIVSDTQVEAGGVLSDGPAVFGIFGGGYSPTDASTIISAGGRLYVAGLSIGAEIESGGLISVTETDYGDNGDGSDLYQFGSISGATVDSGAVVSVAGSPILAYDGTLTSNIADCTFESGSILSFSGIDFQVDYTNLGVISASDNLVGSNSFSNTTLEIGNAIVESGVILTLSAATLGSATISSGGELYLSGFNVSGIGSTVGGATVLAGGLLLAGSDAYYEDLEGAIDVYGVVRSVGMDNAGAAALTVESGGFADSVTMGGNGGAMTVLSGGAAVSTTVQELDNLTVASGATVSGTDVFGYGARVVINGSAVNTIVSDGGDVYGGGDVIVTGVAAGVQVGYAGTLEDHFGEVSGVSVTSGGRFIVQSDIPVTGAVISGGGTLDIQAGSVVYSGTGRTLAGTLQGGGSLVEDGPGVLTMKAAVTRDFYGQIVLSAGTVALALNGEASSATVAFAENGHTATLLIDAMDRPVSGTTFATKMSNFDNSFDRIDLAGLAFTSGAKATVSGGVLTLTNGVYTTKFTLSGTEATKYAVASDGEGGTLVRAVVGATTQGLREAMATFGARAGGAAIMSAHELQSARVETAVSERKGHVLL